MSRIGLKFSQMILHTSTSKMMNNLPFLLVVLHKPTLWPSTFKVIIKSITKLFSLYFSSLNLKYLKLTKMDVTRFAMKLFIS